MEKKLFTLVLSCAVASAVQAQSIYYNETFQNGTPSDMTILDEDHLVANNALVGTGLEDGSWHLLQMNSGDTNYFMGSTSWFTTPGQANDWMITPQIKIHGEGATLSWKGIVCDNSTKCDGYKVYVSTHGNNPADFDSEPIFTIDAEGSAKWTTRTVSLDKYAGQKVYIAFVNDSYNQYVLGIDDICVMGPSAKVSYEFTTPKMTAEGAAHVSATITNVSAETIDQIGMGYAIGKDSVTQVFEHLNLAPNASVALSMEQSIAVNVNDVLLYEQWLTPDGEIEDVAKQDSILGVYFLSHRNTLIEEGTGLWCGNCPLGAVAINYLEKWYADNVICLAIHDNSAGGDPMGLNGYLNYLSLNQFPTGLIDRKFLAGPCGTTTDSQGNYSLMNAGFEYYFLEAQKQAALAEISGTAAFADDANSTIELILSTKFVKDLQQKNYAISIVVVEDSVTDPKGYLYAQHNYFAGPNYMDKSIIGDKDTLEHMGGFAEKDEWILQKFNHVARGVVSGSYGGINAQFPTTIVGNNEYVNPLKFALGDGVVNNPANTYLVAILIDTETSWVENACKIDVAQFTGIGEIVTDKKDDVAISFKGSQVVVSSKNSDPMSISVYSSDGALVNRQKSNSSMSHSFALPRTLKGVYVIKAKVGNDVATKMVIL